ncbi:MULTISPECIES: hypothetical protein [Marinobacter]|uniref:Toxin CptA n=1 Tax=Marinobacter xiaoshiensis TaxID=3073652 RepID=A0ABU2HM03_9GAMM|nr:MULTISPECIES: hypothetical protein [unclassified Marinobacter]MDS1311803.1 hypothetical protein [Marinobacter sp. F60267]
MTSFSPVSSRIDLTLSPSVAVGCLAATPWLTASAFVLIAAAAGKSWLYALAPLTLAGALFQYRLNGLLIGPSAVLGLYLEKNTLYARLGNGQTAAVSACRSSRLNSRMALLKLHAVASRSTSYPVVILSGQRVSGNLPEEQFRRLRLWLRLGRTQQSFD